LNDEVKKAKAELQKLTAELAAVTDKLAGPRMRWRNARDRVAAKCFNLDLQNQLLRNWRPMGIENTRYIDRERSIYLSEARDLEPQERILKAAVREAEIELRQAVKAASQPPAKAASKPTRQPGQLTLF
jgi:hypothetical protein